ncbi:MAG: DUF445 family protein [Lentisphaerae bacterium]|nr:DUF445 family protein [Lentisphaerota bacterium]MBT4819391.1 DUF445 family protein [Lentisphaerota bacterium]MBT5609753.1 DUF445 family protein [Lentisphaerota bacterium]MBT7061395.1 DUF445 family protein [Lentisphaerota bacterium]MBT7845085.1 DUF445 family protein [Lentisphaerota bacterium]
MEWLSFVIFPLVGATIGAITNQIAIKMLFRPYSEIRIHRWRLPFTPGVIPSQRAAIAQNIAHTFESNLFSGDDVHDIITGAETRAAVQHQVDLLLQQFGPMGAMLRPFKGKIVGRLLLGLEDMGNRALADGGSLNIAQRIEERINEMEIAQLEELVLGFSRKQFRHITFFGGVLGAVIGLVQAIIDSLLSHLA